MPTDTPTPAHLREYRCIRAVCAVLNAMPYRVSLAFGWVVARLLFHLVRFRRTEAERRIATVFPERSKREVSGIAWLSLRNMIFNAVELARAKRHGKAFLEAHFEAGEGWEGLSATAAAGQGMILATCHMGNWEMASAYCQTHGVPVFSIAAQQKNPLTNRMINELRTARGSTIMERGSGTMRQVLKRLRSGGTLAILPDVRMRTPGQLVPFLGGEANVGTGMASFMLVAKAPVYPCIIRRKGWTRQIGVAYPPITVDPSLDKQANLATATAAMLAIIDEAVRQTPEQWFWYNKRWILDPLEETGAKPAAAPPRAPNIE